MPDKVAVDAKLQSFSAIQRCSESNLSTLVEGRCCQPLVRIGNRNEGFQCFGVLLFPITFLSFAGITENHATPLILQE